MHLKKEVFDMTKPTVETVAEETVAFIGMRGSFDQIPQGFDQLYGWIARHGLTPGGMPQAVYYSDPATTPEEETMFELWAPLAPDAQEVEPDESGIPDETPPERTVTQIRFPVRKR